MTKKRFMYSILELRLLKSEYERVLNGEPFLYEVMRFDQTKEILESVNQKYTLLETEETVRYKYVQPKYSKPKEFTT